MFKVYTIHLKCNILKIKKKKLLKFYFDFSGFFFVYSKPISRPIAASTSPFRVPLLHSVFLTLSNRFFHHCFPSAVFRMVTVTTISLAFEFTGFVEYRSSRSFLFRSFKTFLFRRYNKTTGFLNNINK